MDYQIAIKKRHLDVNLSGRLYIQDIAQLREQITNSIDSGPNQITLNLSEVTYMDSSGLSLLVVLHKKAINLHGNLTITGATGPVEEIIKRTRLDKILNLH